MARRKTKKTEEIDTTIEIIENEEALEAKDPYAEVLEVTDEFNLQDVSDTPEEVLGKDLDVTEVEAAIEDGAEIELIEEEKAVVRKPEPKRNRTTVDTKVDAVAILKAQAEKEEFDEKRKEKQRMSKVKPVISQLKKNNGIRTSSGLFYR